MKNLGNILMIFFILILNLQLCQKNIKSKILLIVLNIIVIKVTIFFKLLIIDIIKTFNI